MSFVCRHNTAILHRDNLSNHGFIIDESVRVPSFRALCDRVSAEYPSLMAIDWLEIAKKMAEDARAQLALNRKRLQEALAERARQQSAQGPQTNAR